MIRYTDRHETQYGIKQRNGRMEAPFPGRISIWQEEVVFREVCPAIWAI